MTVCRWIAVLVMVFAAQSAAAATLGVAWDPSTEPGVTGYRVYVGTCARPARRGLSTSDGFRRLSSITAAVAGQRYYFSVATQANGLVGRPSAEVSGSTDLSTATTTMQPQTTSRAGAGAPLPLPVPYLQLSSWLAALGPVTSLVADDAGGALFIESGSRIKKVSRNGGVEEVALDATPGERYLSMTLDPDFSNTGHVFIAVESLAGAAPELSVVRHRLLGGALGESARVIAGLPSVGAATRIAVSADHIFVAQTGRVLRFSRDGSVPRDQASGSPLWSAWDGPPEAAIWDEGPSRLVGRRAGRSRGRPCSASSRRGHPRSRCRIDQRSPERHRPEPHPRTGAGA